MEDRHRQQRRRTEEVRLPETKSLANRRPAGRGNGLSPPTEAMETSDVASGERFSPEVPGSMRFSTDQAELALDSLEVRVDCVIVEEGHLIAARRNRTNETQKARRRAKMEAH
ncbi:uncharacterized protein LOC125314484 [Rhodamnia argentea]|uniref:Uncharacterized protein LOC125314484 n=1 Tax=Rhodamnia argentea TaxID=178133 RepID=A0ABM3H896_9MYRT|nr:uncharacterized protein LOC125314484 [Rhodamnia argentea]